MEPHQAAATLDARGYLLLPGLLAPAACAAMREALLTLWRELGEPALGSEEERTIVEGVVADPVGLVIDGVFERRPELANLLAEPRLLAIVHEVLGPRPRLEMGCGILSDRHRPFFFWHNHAGGIDGERVRRQGGFVPPERIERLVCSFYFSPLDAEHGELLVLPRRTSAPLAPIPPRHRAPLEGQERIRAPAGSVLLFEERTHHAVTPMRTDGVRGFVGTMFVRPDAAPTERSDDTLARAAELAPELRPFVAGGDA